MTVGEARQAVESAMRLLRDEDGGAKSRQEVRWTIFGLETISQKLDSAGNTPDQLVLTSLAPERAIEDEPRLRFD